MRIWVGGVYFQKKQRGMEEKREGKKKEKKQKLKQI